jgi:hypothetical protein
MYHVFMCCGQRLGLSFCILAVTFVLGLAAANISIFGPLPHIASPDRLGTPMPVEELNLNKSKVVCVGFEKHNGRGQIPPGILKKLERRDQPQADEQFPGYRLIHPVYRQHCYTMAE